MIATKDPTCFIEDIGAGWVIYRTKDGERWIIRGTCNQCGLCEPTGASFIRIVGELGKPGACVDLRYGTRRDSPVRPEISGKIPECTLSGQYLERAA